MTADISVRQSLNRVILRRRLDIDQGQGESLSWKVYARGTAFLLRDMPAHYVGMLPSTCPFTEVTVPSIFHDPS